MSEHQHHQNQDHRDSHASGASSSSHLESSDAHETKSMPEALKDLAGGVVSQVKQVAENKVGDQKVKVAEGLGDVAHALRQATSARHEPVIDTVRPYVEKAADQMDKVSGYVQNATLRDMANDLESFARREPALFLGGAFALGLIGGRFLKASTPNVDSISSKTSSHGHQNASHDSHNDGNHSHSQAQKNNAQRADDGRGNKNNEAESSASSSNGQGANGKPANQAQTSSGNNKPDQHKSGNDKSQNDKSHDTKASANGNDKKGNQSESKGSESRSSDKAEASGNKSGAASDKADLNDPVSLVKDYSHSDSTTTEEKS